MRDTFLGFSFDIYILEGKFYIFSLKAIASFEFLDLRFGVVTNADQSFIPVHVSVVK